MQERWVSRNNGQGLPIGGALNVMGDGTPAAPLRAHVVVHVGDGDLQNQFWSPLQGSP